MNPLPPSPDDSRTQRPDSDIVEGARMNQVVGFAQLALDCIDRKYPYHLSHVVRDGEKPLPHEQLYPLFHGCYDWHSAVHSHWLLIRFARLAPDSTLTETILGQLEDRFTSEAIAAEQRYLMARPGFERPYGICWLLQLCAELLEWQEPRALRWHSRFRELEQIIAQRVEDWLEQLPFPLRSGQHSQSALAMGLAHDWSRIADHDALRQCIERRAVDFHESDVDAPLHFEPSGYDFLSPSLGVADLMRRIYDRSTFGAWLSRFLPQIPEDGNPDWLIPAISPDSSDGKLSHLHGLNLSRAWMLEGIARNMDAKDPRLAAIESAAIRHRHAGLAAVTDEYYAGSHWLGTFAMYLVTQRGLQ